MKGIFWKEGESFSNSMNLIAFLLVRYPEIGSVRFDPRQKTLQFSFVLTKELSAEEKLEFRKHLLLSLESISQLLEKDFCKTEINFTSCDNLNFLEVTRDVNYLSQEEIALITGVVRQFFETSLLLEQEEMIQEDDIALQEEMIDHMLEDLKDSHHEKRLLGFREEGRVLVFNRANLPK